MSASQLEEHRSYVIDSQKVSAYRRALQHVITPDCVVLDLGAGTGLLGLLAAECGARKVYAVDSGSIINLTREVAANSKMGDRIEHIKKMSTELVLPELVDVVVCDQIGGFVHDAGILGYYHDARERLMKPGGAFVPGSFELRVAAVGGDELVGRVADWDASEPHGFDMGCFADTSANTEHRVNLTADCRLGLDQAVCEIQSDHFTHYGGTVEMAIERPGTLTGFLGTFVATMAPGVTLSNAPWALDRFSRWQNYYPLRSPFGVDSGDTVELRIDVSPKSGVVAWRGSVRRSGEPVIEFHHDTLNGSFSGPDSIIKASRRWVPQITKRLDPSRRLIELTDGVRSIDDIATTLRAEYPGEWVSAESSESFVRWVLGPLVE